MTTLNQLHSFAKHIVIHVDVTLCGRNAAMPTQLRQYAHTHTLGGKLGDERASASSILTAFVPTTCWMCLTSITSGSITQRSSRRITITLMASRTFGTRLSDICAATTASRYLPPKLIGSGIGDALSRPFAGKGYASVFGERNTQSPGHRTQLSRQGCS